MKKILKNIISLLIIILVSKVSLACNPNAGTISVDKKIVCLDEQFTITASGFNFEEDEMSIVWERKEGESGTWVEETVLGTNTTISPTEFSKNTFSYRLKIKCDDTSDESTSNEVKVIVGEKPTKACDESSVIKELRQAVAKVELPGINHDITGFLINTSTNSGSLLFLTTSQPFNCGVGTNLAQAKFKWNEDANLCTGEPISSTSSTGATLLATDGHFALLELTGPLPFEKYFLLGWQQIFPTFVNSIHHNKDDQVKKALATNGLLNTGNPSFYTINCDGEYEENFSIGSWAQTIEKWDKGGFVKESRGAPLISNDKAVGIHLAAKDEKECTFGESLGAFFFNAGSPIMQHLAPDGATSASSISYEPCRDEIIVNSTLVIDTLVKASVRVVGCLKLIM